MRNAFLILCLFISLILGCRGSWQRVYDLDKSLPIDQADCSVFAKTLVAERGDYISSTTGFAYALGSGVTIGSASTKTKVDRSAYSLYFQQCMNERGWVASKGEHLAPASDIRAGTFILMDTAIKRNEVLLRETSGFYPYSSKVLSEDIRVRLLGKKIDDIIEFEKEIPIARTATQVERNKLLVNIKIKGIYKAE